VDHIFRGGQEKGRLGWTGTSVGWCPGVERDREWE